jgi:hypothetical protein
MAYPSETPLMIYNTTQRDLTSVVVLVETPDMLTNWLNKTWGTIHFDQDIY